MRKRKDEERRKNEEGKIIWIREFFLQVKTSEKSLRRGGGGLE